jgi:hypothetical protein
MRLSEERTNPQHYRQSGRKKQPIELMYEGMTPDEFRGYVIGNVIKYIMRYKEKNGVEDLEKAKVYIGFLEAVEKGYSPLYEMNK